MGTLNAAAQTPAFRKPWQHGAKAYHEADSIEAMLAGLGRLRNELTVLIPHSTHSLDGRPCDACGLDLAGPSPHGDTADQAAYVDVDPRTRQFVCRHYYCAWTTTIAQVMKLREAVG